MRNIASILIFFLLLSSCAGVKENTAVKQNHVKSIINEFKDAASTNVLVAAHRGDWRHAPENSIKGIENCIQLGVDIVEVDVRKTKDNQLVLMHDNTIDRMTTGTGKISDYTLRDLKQFYLKDNRGGKQYKLTNHRIPTLEEALLVSKGKIMLNLDKSYHLMKDIYPILKKTGTLHLVIFKGSSSPLQIKNDISFMEKTVFFMPIVSDKSQGADKIIRKHIDLYDPAAFELLLRKNDLILNNASYIKDHGSRVWVNTLWVSLCAGFTDAKSLKDPDANWGHLIKKGVNIIQTDNPIELLQYLDKKGLHDF